MEMALPITGLELVLCGSVRGLPYQLECNAGSNAIFPLATGLIGIGELGTGTDELGTGERIDDFF